MGVTESNMKSLIERISVSLFKFWGLICVKNTVDGAIFLYRPFIFGICLKSLTVSINFYGLMLEANRFSRKWMPTSTAIVVTFVHNGAIAATYTVIGVFAAWNYKKIGKLYFTMEKIEKRLNVDKGYVKTFTIFSISIVLLIMLYIWDYYVCSQIHQFYFWYTPTYVHELLFVIFIFQLLLITNRIKTLFHSLNTELIKTLQSTRKQYTQQNLPTVETISASTKMFASEIISLPSLCDLHFDTCEAIDCFNIAFKTQLQFQFFTMFLQLIDCPYFIFLTLNGSESSSLNIQYTLISLAYTLLQIAEIFVIVLPCGAATKTGNEMSFILCKHLDSGLPMAIKKKIKSSIKLLEVHRTEFHCGIFTLNESVISAVTGSVTTYLVILIQFQNQEFET